ncbi:MAG TPA: DUF4304 domain-containing protein [Bryobacteraceae bacterium]|nr:DUF4304 domain-containing protein [Bryobacteraceae bacterium]
MDSKVVAREIKREVWPLLRQEGFTEFSPKTAWRHTSDQIHVVNYQSFNNYLAEGVGCTTFSFALNLGIFFHAIPVEYPVRKGFDPSVKPQEYHCHFRHRLLKGIDQPILKRRDTWYVEPDGGNLLQCLDDSRSAIVQEGLPWFARFESLEYVLSLLMDHEELPEVYATRNSPARKRMIGYVARRLGRTDLAEPLIAEAESDFKAIREQGYSIGRRRKPK